jgi:hypothetical protein
MKESPKEARKMASPVLSRTYVCLDGVYFRFLKFRQFISLGFRQFLFLGQTVPGGHNLSTFPFHGTTWLPALVCGMTLTAVPTARFIVDMFWARFLSGLSHIYTFHNRTGVDNLLLIVQIVTNLIRTKRSRK